MVKIALVNGFWYKHFFFFFFFGSSQNRYIKQNVCVCVWYNTDIYIIKYTLDLEVLYDTEHVNEFLFI